ncbi:MAG: hypothetical protein QOJ22_1026 [Thermoleophilaceae bacterium]|nr:hypothetical protein [Thermoleophilaceae bacterium]
MFVLTIHQLADEITTLSAHIHAATCRWLLLVAEFDRREGWGDEGCKTCADWISWKCGMAPGAAREHVRVARRLEALPVVQAAFARGELSYSKVRALTRVEDVTDEDELVELARHATGAQLERLVRAYRRVLSVEDDGERAWNERSLTWSYDDDGSVVLRGHLPAEQGALVIAALEAAREQLPQPAADVSAETSAQPGADVSAETSGRARNADALAAIAETSLSTSPQGGTADRYQVVVHVDAGSLTGSDDGGRCDVGPGVPLTDEAARRLTCDSSLVRVIERDGQPLSVGRRTRSIPPPLRRALNCRDGGCRFPGCTQTRRVDAHHILHWAHGGRTELDNLVQLCRHHHRLLHEGGFGVRRGAGGRLVFRSPAGRTLPAVPRPKRGDHTRLTAHNVRRGVRVSAETCVPRSYTPLNLDYGLQAVLAFTGRRAE